MFRTRGNQNDPLRYSIIVVHGISVGFIRIGSASRPFSLVVPRVHDETFMHASAEDLARLAIAQALRAELFDAHPESAIDLDIHGPRWEGDLDGGQKEQPQRADSKTPEPLETR